MKKRSNMLWYRQPPPGLKPTDHLLRYDPRVWESFYYMCSGYSWYDRPYVDELWFQAWVLMKRHFRRTGKPEYARLVDVILAAQPLPNSRPNVG